jgi:hypothetical protein
VSRSRRAARGMQQSGGPLVNTGIVRPHAVFCFELEDSSPMLISSSPASHDPQQAATRSYQSTIVPSIDALH